MLQGTIPLSLKVKIMDLEFLCESFTLKMLQDGKAQFRRAILSSDRSCYTSYQTIKVGQEIFDFFSSPEPKAHKVSL